MIKNILSSKVTSTASAQFVVFGLKMLDSHTLRLAGICLCAASLAILIYGWQLSHKAETAPAPPPHPQEHSVSRFALSLTGKPITFAGQKLIQFTFSALKLT